MRSHKGILILSLAALPLLGGATYFAATKQAATQAPAKPANPNVDRRAVDVMKSVGETYAHLSSLSVDIQISQPGPSKEPVRASLKYQKPGLLLVHRELKNKSMTAVDDGNSLYIFSPQLKEKYIATPSQTSIFGVLRQLYTYIGEEGFQSMFNLLGQENLLPDASAIRSLKLGEPGSEGGTAVDRVIATVGRTGQDELTVTYSVGQNDHLLYKLEVKPTGSSDAFVETYTNVKVDQPLSKSLFAFTAPAGAKAVSPPIYYDPRLKPGVSPAPIRSVDLNGKPITLDQYKGKITMVYFWGTWCPACVQEIPDIVSVYNKYKSKGFEVVGVPLEEKMNEARVAAFLSRRGLTWRQAFEGKRDGNVIAENYRISATPFSMLIGKDGKIVAVDLRGEKEITAAIDKALTRSS